MQCWSGTTACQMTFMFSYCYPVGHKTFKTKWPFLVFVIIVSFIARNNAYSEIWWYRILICREQVLEKSISFPNVVTLTEKKQVNVIVLLIAYLLSTRLIVKWSLFCQKQIWSTLRPITVALDSLKLVTRSFGVAMIVSWLILRVFVTHARVFTGESRTALPPNFDYTAVATHLPPIYNGSTAGKHASVFISDEQWLCSSSL